MKITVDFEGGEPLTIDHVMSLILDKMDSSFPGCKLIKYKHPSILLDGPQEGRIHITSDGWDFKFTIEK